LELNPQDVSVRAKLCRALLYKRDFAAARVEFAAAQKSAVEQSASANTDRQKDLFGDAAAEASEGAVWSYFLERDYAGTVSAAANYKPTQKHVSVNSLLLSYFSLLRLGRQAEAESLLRKESAKFTGSAEEHVLLLQAQGRVTEGFPYSDPKSEASRRALFFDGLHDIATGHPDAARRHLGYIPSEPSDSVFTLAAKMELERLGPPPKK
jgi:hypothetical protein